MKYQDEEQFSPLRLLPTLPGRSRLELTVSAAEHLARRELMQDTYSPQGAADWYRGVIDSSDAGGLLALGREFGSLAGLVLAAESVGAA